MQTHTKNLQKKQKNILIRTTTTDLIPLLTPVRKVAHNVEIGFLQKFTIEK